MTAIIKVCHECEEFCDPSGKHQVSGLDCDHKKYTYWPKNFGDKDQYTKVQPHTLTQEELADVYSQEYAEEAKVQA